MDIDFIQSKYSNMENKNKIKKSYLKNSKITPKKYHNLLVLLTLTIIMKFIKL